MKKFMNKSISYITASVIIIPLFLLVLYSTQALDLVMNSKSKYYEFNSYAIMGLWFFTVMTIITIGGFIYKLFYNHEYTLSRMTCVLIINFIFMIVVITIMKLVEVQDLKRIFISLLISLIYVVIYQFLVERIINITYKYLVSWRTK